MVKTKSVFEEVDADIEARAIAEAEADIDAGRFVSHEDVVKWLRSLGKPDELPCPVPRPRWRGTFDDQTSRSSA